MRDLIHPTKRSVICIAIFVVIVAVLVVACVSGGNDAAVREITSLSVKAPPVEPEMINGITVPPEPPADLNNSTLAGIDVNGNGVRDDIDRYVATEYPVSAKIRSSLTQRAAALQKILTSTDHASNKLLLDAARDCMSASFIANSSDVEGGRKARVAAAALNAKVVNTDDRVRAYAAYNQTRGGTISNLTPLENTASKCLVNPSSLSDTIRAIEGVSFQVAPGWVSHVYGTSSTSFVAPSTNPPQNGAHEPEDVNVDLLPNPDGLTVEEFVGMKEQLQEYQKMPVTVGGRPALRVSNVGGVIDRSPSIIVYASHPSGSILSVVLPRYEYDLNADRMAGFDHIVNSVRFE